MKKLLTIITGLLISFSVFASSVVLQQSAWRHIKEVHVTNDNGYTGYLHGYLDMNMNNAWIVRGYNVIVHAALTSDRPMTFMAGQPLATEMQYMFELNCSANQYRIREAMLYNNGTFVYDSGIGVTPWESPAPDSVMPAVFENACTAGFRSAVPIKNVQLN